MKKYYIVVLVIFISMVIVSNTFAAESYKIYADNCTLTVIPYSYETIGINIRRSKSSDHCRVDILQHGSFVTGITLNGRNYDKHNGHTFYIMSRDRTGFSVCVKNNCTPEFDIPNLRD